MTIFDYQLTDLLFAHWLTRKREMLAEHKQIPRWLDKKLDKLRPLRNPNCSIFVMDSPFQSRAAFTPEIVMARSQ